MKMKHSPESNYPALETYRYKHSTVDLPKLDLYSIFQCIYLRLRILRGVSYIHIAKKILIRKHKTC
jgi:hypothetical protein